MSEVKVAIPKKGCTAIFCPLCDDWCAAGSTDSCSITNNGACLQCCSGKSKIEIQKLTLAKAFIKPSSKTLARHGSLDEYVDSLPAHDSKPEVWKNINDNSCINVSHIGSKYAYWSEDGSSDSHSMDIKYFTENYRLAGIGEKLSPVVDDTFNDDTPAQTFGDIQWDIGTDEKCEAILVTVCSKCGSTVPADSVVKPALNRWAARFLLALAAICFAFLFSILALVIFEQLDIDRIFFKAVAFITTLGFLFLFLYFYLSEGVSE